jgi:alkylation response protein AidB-like acyl-CoA dehydrogenase
MSATDYTYDLRDLEFVLFEQLNVAELLKQGYPDFEADDLKMIVGEAHKFAKEVIAPSNKIGDEVGVKLENGKVTLPKEFVEVYKQYSEAGWLAGSGSPEAGGQGFPHVLTTAVADIFTGANVSFFLYGLLGVGVAHVIEKYNVPDWAREIVLPKLFSGEWAGTMMLTEPQAGSDVGMAKTKAEKVEGTDYYHIRGTKMFITGGDHDLTENIWHLALARTPGAPAGTKGLSLFLVPKIRIDENGNLTEPNDVVCSAVEHKMGIKGSATCQMSLGDNNECRGWLVGNEGDGIMVMFNMMNEARIEVGVQGMSVANAAYQNALSYSRDRLQGSSFKEWKNPDAPRVAIIEHPDVRRQLMTMKAVGEGLRSLMLYASWCADMAHHATDPAEREKFQGFLELLTPICKAYSTDRGVEMSGMAIQVYGGYGYTKDYPVEQLMRDAKIGCIYEGTNSIQSLDLMGRKLGMKKGAIFMSYLAELDAIAGKAKETPELTALVKAFTAAKDRLASSAMLLGGWGMQRRLDLATSRAVSFLELMGDVVIAAELLKGAIVAAPVLNKRLADAGVDAANAEALHAHLSDSTESALYHGKIKNAEFFITQWLPRTEGLASIIACETTPHMDVVF